jgi:RNA polymerase sigma-70 factor (ECF subfamily)
MHQRLPLSAVFLAPGPDQRAPSEALEAELLKLCRTAQAAWPTLELPLPVFLRHVAALLPAGKPPEESLAALHAGDLYLACACAQGTPAALRLFEERFLGQVPAFLAGRGLVSAQVEEVQQRLRERLLVRTPAAPPRIADYSGRGPLQAWLRIAAIRTAISLRRNRDEQVGGRESDALVQALPGGGDPELDFLKARYRREFAEALGAAVQALPTEERNLLRMHMVDGLSAEKLAALFQVHRVTVTRRLAAARRSLLDEVRRLLEHRLRLRAGEFDSLLRLVRSRLDVSIRAMLKGSG